MSDHNYAYLGYGFEVDDEEICTQLEEGDLKLEDGFELAGARDGYEGPEQSFVFLKSSMSTSFGDGTFIKKDSLLVEDGWNTRLSKVAKKLGISKPKIGWWLLSDAG